VFTRIPYPGQPGTILVDGDTVWTTAVGLMQAGSRGVAGVGLRPAHRTREGRGNVPHPSSGPGGDGAARNGARQAGPLYAVDMNGRILRTASRARVEPGPWRCTPPSRATATAPPAFPGHWERGFRCLSTSPSTPSATPMSPTSTSRQSGGCRLEEARRNYGSSTPAFRVRVSERRGQGGPERAGPVLRRVPVDLAASPPPRGDLPHAHRHSSRFRGDRSLPVARLVSYRLGLRRVREALRQLVRCQPGSRARTGHTEERRFPSREANAR